MLLLTSRRPKLLLALPVSLLVWIAFCCLLCNGSTGDELLLGRQTSRAKTDASLGRDVPVDQYTSIRQKERRLPRTHLSQPSRFRRAFDGKSTTKEEEDAAQNFYHVSYLKTLNLPTLTQAKQHNVTSRNVPFVRETEQVVQLPFTFEFFGHNQTQVVFSEHGFLYPHHSARPCSIETEECFWGALWQSSHISPLTGDFIVLPPAGNHMTYYSHKDFVHFVWNVQVYESCWAGINGPTYPCDSGYSFKFSTTLYRNGSIQFSYESLPDKADFEYYLGQYDFDGKVGLADSSIHDNSLEARDWTVFRYAALDLSAMLQQSSSQRPATIIFTPTTSPKCFTAIDKAECSKRSSALGCFWCPVADWYAHSTAPFCTDGRRDRNVVHAEDRLCSLEKPSANLAKQIHNHTYYTVESSSSHFANLSLLTQALQSSPVIVNSTLHSTRIRLPFAFPYYGHEVRTIDVLRNGYVFPHSEFCEQLDVPCSEAFRLRTSFIAPLYSNWVFDRRSAGSVLVFNASSGAGVHVLWHNLYRYCEPAADCLYYCGCDDHEPTTFSLSLYSDGRISFNYIKLPASHLDFTFTGLRDSFSAFSSSLRYDDVNISSILGRAGGVKSVTFKPNTNLACGKAKTEAECRHPTTSSPCFWCEASGSGSHTIRNFSCSTGLQGHWELNTSQIVCKAFIPSGFGLSAPTFNPITTHGEPDKPDKPEKSKSGVAVGVSLGILALLLLAVAVIVISKRYGNQLTSTLSFVRFLDDTPDVTSSSAMPQPVYGLPGAADGGGRSAAKASGGENIYATHPGIPAKAAESSGDKAACDVSLDAADCTSAVSSKAEMKEAASDLPSNSCAV